MKQILTLVCALSFGAVTMFGASKGDHVRATNVFEGKLLSSVSQGPVKINLKYNDDNQLISAAYAKFDYTAGEKDGFAYDMMITEKDDEETIELYFRLNDQLMACEVYQIEKEVGEPATYERWSLEYNSDLQLCKVTRNQSKEISTLTYENGNITKVVVEEIDDKDRDTYDLFYTDQIANPSGFMMFEEMFSVDLEDMEIAYYAGILGKPTSCLPQKKYDSSDRYTEVFDWTLDSDGYPTKIKLDDEYFNLKWVEAAGINSVVVDSLDESHDTYFNLNGIPLIEPQKGLNIVRHSDGKVSKVIIR